MSDFQPAWVKNLGTILDTLADNPTYAIKAKCSARDCEGWTDIDIPALAKKVGREYSLWNRRSPCRFDPKCRGWNSFGYTTGTWVWHMYDDATDMRWFLGPSERPE